MVQISGTEVDLPGAEDRARGVRSDGTSPLNLPEYNPDDDNPYANDGRRVDPETSREMLRSMEPSEPSSQSQTAKKPNNQPFVKRVTNSLLKSSSGQKWLYALALSGGLTTVLILAGLLFFASLLKIPNLAANITEYEFVRLTRQFSDSVDRTAQEALAEETASVEPEGNNKPSLREQWLEKYQNLSDGVNDKLGRVVPSVAVSNLKRNSGLELVTHNIGPADTKNPLMWGKTSLDAVKLDGKTFEIKPQTGTPSNFISKITGLQDFKDQISFTRDFAPALSDSLAANEVGPIIRSLAANKLRQELGISMVAWIVGNFAGKNPTQAELEINREAYNEIAEGGQVPVQEGLVSDINNAEQEMLDETTRDVAKDNTLTDIITKGGVDTAAQATAEQVVGESALKSVVGFINPAYAIALPACIIYEGSLDESGPTVNSQIAAQQRAFYFIASAADQQKSGVFKSEDWKSQITAIGAINQKVGDISHSNPYMRANGLNADTTVGSLSAEGSPMGDYTLIDATPYLGGSGVGEAIKGLANGACPALSNIWFGIGSGVALQLGTLFADLFTGGGATVGEEAAAAGIETGEEVAAKTVTQRIVDAVIEQFSGKSIGDYAAKLRSIVGDGVKTGITLSALTIIAKLIVMARAGQLYNGLEQGPDLANEADSGGNIHANELARQMGGRPLTCAELATTNQEDTGYLASINKRKNLTERYLALSNPDSLLSHVSTAIYTQIGGSLTKPVGDALLGSSMSGPFSISTTLHLLSGTTLASVPCSHYYYGNVQFGWSQPEEKLISSNDSYLPLQNQAILDQSHQEQAIAQKYASCFGYSFNKTTSGSLDPTDPTSELQTDITGVGSLGTLLSSGAIARTPNGDIITDQGLCAPVELGANNAQFGDLVFRFRLALSYDITMNHLSSLQTISTN